MGKLLEDIFYALGIPPQLHEFLSWTIYLIVLIFIINMGNSYSKKNKKNK